jgi:hypothetical protein
MLSPRVRKGWALIQFLDDACKYDTSPAEVSQPKTDTPSGFWNYVLVLLERQRPFEEAREIRAKDPLAIPAPPRRLLRIKVIKIDASTGADDLEALATSLNDLYILGPNWKVHRHPFVDCYRDAARPNRQVIIFYPVHFSLASGVAYFMVHFPRGFFPIRNGGELALLYCFVYLYFFFAGPGSWSADGILRKKK